MSLVYDSKRQQNPNIENDGGERETEIRAQLEQMKLYETMTGLSRRSQKTLDALIDNMQQGRFSIPSGTQPGLDPPPSLGAGPGDTADGTSNDAQAQTQGCSRQAPTGLTETEARSALEKLTFDNARLLMLANGNDLGIDNLKGFDPTASTTDQVRAYTNSLVELNESLKGYEELYSKQSLEAEERTDPNPHLNVETAGPDSCSGLPPHATRTLLRAQDSVRRLVQPLAASSSCHTPEGVVTQPAIHRDRSDQETISAGDIAMRKIDMSQVTSFLTTHGALSESVEHIYQDLMKRRNDVEDVPSRQRKKHSKQPRKKRQKKATGLSGVKPVDSWADILSSYQSTYQQVQATLRRIDPAPTDDERQQLREASADLQNHLTADKQLSKDVMRAHSLALIDGGSLDDRFAGGSCLGEIETLTRNFAIGNVLDQSSYDICKREWDQHKPSVSLLEHPSSSVDLLQGIDRTEGIARSLYDQWRKQQISQHKHKERKNSDGNASDVDVDLPSLLGLTDVTSGTTASASRNHGLPDPKEILTRMRGASHLTNDQRAEGWKMYTAARGIQAKCDGYSDMYNRFTETLDRTLAEHTSRLDNLEKHCTSGDDEAGRTALKALRAKVEVDQLEARQIYLQRQRAADVNSAVAAGLSLEDYQRTITSQVRDQADLDTALRDARTKLKEHWGRLAGSEFEDVATIDDLIRKAESRTQRGPRSASLTTTPPESNLTGPSIQRNGCSTPMECDASLAPTDTWDTSSVFTDSAPMLTPPSSSDEAADSVV
ncbi:hypothetical protein IAT40_001666 [Kwoniella sp. CBS 6097]